MVQYNHNPHEFKKKFEELKHAMQENAQELTAIVQEEHTLEQENATMKKKLQENDVKLAHIKPEVRRLEHEKVKEHQDFQQVEFEVRQEINESLSHKDEHLRPMK
jgi:predicted nuclease with TOPRIM domain